MRHVIVAVGEDASLGICTIKQQRYFVELFRGERSPLGLRCTMKRHKSTVGTLLKARYEDSS